MLGLWYGPERSALDGDVWQTPPAVGVDRIRKYKAVHGCAVKVCSLSTTPIILGGSYSTYRFYAILVAIIILTTLM